MKLNSLFVPESESCYIPQVCRVCQSASEDSRIVGLEVVSFTSSSEQEQEQGQARPVKQVVLSCLISNQFIPVFLILEIFNSP